MGATQTKNGAISCENPFCEMADIAYIARYYSKKGDLYEFFKLRDDNFAVNDIEMIRKAYRCIDASSELMSGPDRAKAQEIAKLLNRMLGEINEFDDPDKTNRVLSNAYRLIADNVEMLIGKDWENRSSVAQKIEQFQPMTKSNFYEPHLDMNDDLYHMSVKLMDQLNKHVAKYTDLRDLDEMTMRTIKNSGPLSLREMLTIISSILTFTSIKLYHVSSEDELRKVVDRYMPTVEIAIEALFVFSPTPEFQSLAVVIKEKLDSIMNNFREKSDIANKDNLLALLSTADIMMGEMAREFNNEELSIPIMFELAEPVLMRAVVFGDPVYFKSEWNDMVENKPPVPKDDEYLNIIAQGIVRRIKYFNVDQNEEDILYGVFNILTDLDLIAERYEKDVDSGDERIDLLLKNRFIISRMLETYELIFGNLEYVDTEEIKEWLKIVSGGRLSFMGDSMRKLVENIARDVLNTELTFR